MTPSETGFIEVPGARLYYEAEGDGPPVLLLHAGVADRRMWEPLWPGLTARRDVVRVDLRGFGGTTARPDGPLAPWRDVLGLSDAQVDEIEGSGALGGGAHKIAAE